MKGMLGRASALIGAALSMMAPQDHGSSIGLTEEGEMLLMSKEERLKYDRERRKRKPKIRQTMGFDYKKRNKKLREAKRMRAKNRV